MGGSRRYGDEGVARASLRVDGSLTPRVASVSTRKRNSTSSSLNSTRWAWYGAGEVVDVEVAFDLCVHVLGSPTLLLSNGGRAVVTTGGAVQYVDVGAHAVPALESGEWALTYDGRFCACVGWDADAEDLVNALAKIGLLQTDEFDDTQRGVVKAVSSLPRKGGTRFTFRFHEDAAAEAVGVGEIHLCAQLAPSSPPRLATHGMYTIEHFSIRLVVF